MINSLPLANVIIPLFAEFYFGLIFCSVIVIPLESYIFKKLEKIKFSRILTYVFFANIVSWVFGFILSVPLQLIEFHKFTSDSDKEKVIEAFCTFIVAFFLSWLIEYIFIIFFKKRLSLKHPFKTTCYANMFSYLTIFVIVFGWIIIEGLFF